MGRKPSFLILSLAMLFLGAEVGHAGSLVVHWAFDETSGSLVHDTSGNGHDGIITGTPDWVPGQMAGALHFDGSSYVAVDDAIGQFTAISVALWFKYDSFIVDWNSIWHNNGWQGEWLHHMVTNYAGQDVRVQFAVNGAGDQFGITPIETDTWYHSVVTYDSTAGEMNFYLTTAEERTANLDVALQVNGPPVTLTAGQIGGWEGNRLSSATFDDIRIYDRVLTESHVQDLLDGISPNFSKAEGPNPADGAIGVTSPLLQWSNGETAMFHNVYLGTNPDLTEADLKAPRQPFAMYYHILGLEPGVTYYWRVDEVEADMVTVHTGDVWSFTAMPLTAYAPVPADGGEGAAQAPTLSWLAGQGAVGHRVYLGDAPDAVKEGSAETNKGDVAETAFSVGLLRAGTAYYWRVDETDSAGGIQIGEVWSFTTGQPADGKVVREWWLGIGGTAINALTTNPRYPGSPDGTELVDLFEGPVDWADNYGSRLYGWLIPPESGDYTFWIATDDGGELWLSTDEDPANGVLIASVPTWVPARDFDNTGGGLGDADAQESDAIALAAGAKYYIEALMNEGGGGDNVAVAWQVPGGTREVIPGEFVSTYALPPLRAAGPSPENGAVDTDQAPTLSWFAGENATGHHVYFGDDADAVAGADTTSAEYKGRQAGITYNPGALEWGKTYFWRVDEEEADGTVRTGAVWGFTTAAFLVIEDFESYDDDMEAGTAIFQTWIDGWENGTGSTVGHLQAVGGTFGETSVVYTGDQSMPLDYNNVNAPYYSETSRTFAPAVNMTVGGMDTLTLYLRGQGSNDPAPLYIGLRSGATHVNVPCGDETLVQSTSWVEVNVPLADFAGVNAAAVNEMFISLGNPDAPTSGGAGLIYIDDIRATRPEATETALP